MLVTRGRRHARHDRQGREAPGGVQPAAGRGLPAASATRTALLRAEDFNDDRKDAGEIGAGHSVTALYEIVPAGVGCPLPGVDPLKYQEPATAIRGGAAAASC